ncbi:MAG: sugar ABC transporter ATP-binding protein [Candidatus Devosia phytovorans]|uniref:Sugar ABC transporter ATP-binding protein n=1 Tax=Candidatus Devosia phytovorans TaxID=3121372 RepID=A0AAJ6AZ60_9HYPH|nr:sugar ABC transporter ATP-binding protein [Devosia sp.]WEK03772.1 MAG: sugar ABC transporter ATP-binding protein [Devosia sp.]
MAPLPPLLAATGVAKSYAGVPALRGADLVIAPGEVHALIGENGAGKSTLIKILAGVVTADSATITVDGRPAEIDSTKSAYRLGLRFIHQEFNVVPTLSVAENIFMGRRYPRRAGVLVDWAVLNAQAQRALTRLGIDHIDPRLTLGQLSLGDQMLVRISAALLDDARLYVMDEPTAALTRDESERLFRVLREIRASGSSVLYVSHRLDEIMALCDRATVLRDGKSIDSGKMADITHDDLVAMMIGRKVEEAYPKAQVVPRDGLAFETTGLEAPDLGPLDFTLRQGEILGIAGLSGAGQAELVHTLFGDIRPTAGAMTLDGKPYTPSGPGAAWAAGIAYVPRERRAQGLIMRRPIFENITLTHLKRQSLGGIWLTPRRERAFATRIGQGMQLKSVGPDQPVFELSGGNQQKVVFGRALAERPRLLLLEEPTRGVDIGAKFDIYAILRDLAAQGTAIILVSSDLPELLGMSDRIAVMRDGCFDALVDAAGLGEDDLINLCYGRVSGNMVA